MIMGVLENPWRTTAPHHDATENDTTDDARKKTTTPSFCRAQIVVDWPNDRFLAEHKPPGPIAGGNADCPDAVEPGVGRQAGDVNRGDALARRSGTRRRFQPPSTRELVPSGSLHSIRARSRGKFHLKRPNLASSRAAFLAAPPAPTTISVLREHGSADKHPHQ
jgi:hypothetical protein